ncbi:hypothetical protein PHLGIDRAFT_107570 [Phlebiopsis gigantea 11061_1 CR5-6]|uniref:Cytochrome P450 n=1 Tax=Phlebiopsis gigantea (strain 11061_1 CR5-6) TaxID=745531 RepID=A0A0C3RWK5_PHLG1|nr:hypothetical protein PHLGIDRAFT_107570 [Phlebiopsis gigantea 11061_1 CR5-6]
MTSTTLVTLLAAVVAYVLKVLLDFHSAVRSIRNHPGTRTVIDALSPIGMMVVTPIPVLAHGNQRSWKYKHAEYAELGYDILSSVAAFPRVNTDIFVADAAVIKEITTNRSRFPKPVDIYKVISFFGDNIVGTEGDEWKRFRKIIAPSFSERNNRLVWDGTVKIMNDLFEAVWGSKEEVTVDNSTDLTIPIALFIIGVAGFGRSMSWTDDVNPSSDHTMPFKDALHIASSGVFAKAATPNWLLNLAPTEHLREVKTAYPELHQYMTEMVQARRTAEKKVEQHDLFTSLLDANEDEDDGQAKLADSELLGNIFIFLLAGHETTAHTLCFTFGLLALYQEQQEKLYQQIRSVIPEGRIPSALILGRSVFYETLRLFPPVAGVPKTVAEDTALVTADSFGNKVTVPVLQGTSLVLNIAALHYNPRYWDDPHAFKPERFHGDWPRDAFLPFSGGARSCLGRRWFFETEGIAIMTMLVSRYKIEVKEEAEFAGETFAERKERVLRSKRGVTTTPVRMPLVFKRR